VGGKKGKAKLGTSQQEKKTGGYGVKTNQKYQKIPEDSTKRGRQKPSGGRQVNRGRSGEGLVGKPLSQGKESTCAKSKFMESLCTVAKREVLPREPNREKRTGKKRFQSGVHQLTGQIPRPNNTSRLANLGAAHRCTAKKGKVPATKNLRTYKGEERLSGRDQPPTFKIREEKKEK